MQDRHIEKMVGDLSAIFDIDVNGMGIGGFGKESMRIHSLVRNTAILENLKSQSPRSLGSRSCVRLLPSPAFRFQRSVSP